MNKEELIKAIKDILTKIEDEANAEYKSLDVAHEVRYYPVPSHITYTDGYHSGVFEVSEAIRGLLDQNLTN